MTGKTVLVTGASGFIGRHAAKVFAAKGWYVVGIGHGDWQDSTIYGLQEWHNKSVTLASLLELNHQFDTVIHCAGGSSVGASIERPGADFDRTVKTTSDVLEFIRRYSAKTRLVYLSSAAVYGNVTTVPIAEEVSLNPVSPYGFHKMMSEGLCRLYCLQYGLSAAIVRPFSIYGAGLRKQLLWDACRKLERGICDFFGTGKEIRDWLHVEDLARLLYIASENSSPSCYAVNAGSGQGVTNEALLGTLSAQFDIGLLPLFSSAPKIGDPHSYIADTAKAEAWHWQSSIAWQDGVVDYVEWYKKCIRSA